MHLYLSLCIQFNEALTGFAKKNYNGIWIYYMHCKQIPLFPNLPTTSSMRRRRVVGLCRRISPKPGSGNNVVADEKMWFKYWDGCQERKITHFRARVLISMDMVYWTWYNSDRKEKSKECDVHFRIASVWPVSSSWIFFRHVFNIVVVLL